MSQPRYFLPDHSNPDEIYSKEELRTLLVKGDLSRSDIVVDDQTGLAHLLGDLLSRPRAERPMIDQKQEKVERYQEFSADTPLSASEQVNPEDDDEEYEADSEEEDNEDLSPTTARSSRQQLSLRQQSQYRRPSDEAEEDEEADEESSAEDDGEEEDEAEHLLYHLHPSWFSYPRTLFIFLLSSAAAAYCYREHVGMLYVLLGGSIAGICLLNISLDRSTTEYLVTTRRVESETGIVGRNSKEVRICDIRAIDVHQEGFNALMGLGTVDFCSAGGSAVDVQFKNIRNPHKIKKVVRGLQG